MMIKDWKLLRISLLAITFSGVALVLGKILIYPTQYPPIKPFNFPPNIPLEGWQILGTEPISIKPGSNIQSTSRYRYQKDKISLDIDMRYLVNTDGKIDTLTEEHTFSQAFPVRLSLVNIPRIGWHGLFVTKERAYLSTCINPRGTTTVTNDQFRNNRNTYDIRLDHVVLWLLGTGELRDQRCLWTQMSIPLNQTSQNNAYNLLESAWASWYKQWENKFPNP
jgi:cyanosortase A-associated protein